MKSRVVLRAGDNNQSRVWLARNKAGRANDGGNEKGESFHLKTGGTGVAIE